MKTEAKHTPIPEIIEKSQVYKIIGHEIYYGKAFIVKAVNCHEEFLEILKMVDENTEKHGRIKLSTHAMVKQAIAKAEA